MLFGFHSKNLNIYKSALELLKKHNNHENVIAIWDDQSKRFNPKR
jgi:hypothetical protein